MLVWCCSVLVLKKLDDEHLQEFIKALRHLVEDENLTVVVEPHEYEKLVGPQEQQQMRLGKTLLPLCCQAASDQ